MVSCEICQICYFEEHLRLTASHFYPFCIQSLCCIMHCKARQLYAIYIVLTKKMAQKLHLWQELDLMQARIWKYQLYFQIYLNLILEPLANSLRRLAWAHKLKASKSSSQISLANWLKVSLMKSCQNWYHIVLFIACWVLKKTCFKK